MPLLHHMKNGPYGLARVLQRVLGASRLCTIVQDRVLLSVPKNLDVQRSLKHVVSTHLDNEETQMKTINLDEKLNQFSSHWDPHVIADYNDNDVMVVRFIGEYPFHKHGTTDDFFYVLEGEMEMDIEGGSALRSSVISSSRKMAASVARCSGVSGSIRHR